MSKSLSRPSRVSSLFRFVLLSGAALGAVGQAAAQEAAPSEDEIVVTGRRPLAESEAAALRAQQQSDSLVSIVSGDTIGNLPDQNVAFAVGRLPGVAIERDQGQARYVNLRGLPNRWVTLSFDGLSVVSPEGRATRFDNIPSAIASQVAVEKAILPSMPGDTVAGNVNIRTRRAQDYDGFNVRGNLGVGYVQLGGGEEIDSSLVLSNTFMNERLGVLVQASYYTRNMVTDNWETDPYLNTTTTPDERFAREYENKPYRLTRENISFSTRLDFRIDDNNELFASSIFTTYADQELRTNYIFRFDQGTRAAGSVPNFGTVFATRINANFNALESREYIFTNTLGGEHQWGGFDVSWRANYTFTDDGRDVSALPNFQSPSGATNRPTVVYDFRDGANNTVSLFNTTQTGSVLGQGAAQRSVDAFPIAFQDITRRDGSDFTQAYTLKADVTYETEFLGRNVEFGAGFMWSDRTKTSKEDNLRVTAARLTQLGLPQLQVTDFQLGRSYLGEYQLGYDFRYHSQSALESIMNRYINTGVAQRVDSWQNWWQVNEQLTAFYGMATIDYDWGNIILGARVEQIETEGRSWLTLAGARTRVDVPNEETLIYPSLHFNWNLTEDARLRVSLTSTASRADFNQLRPNFSFSDSARTVSGGNPLALPERQTGLDVYYEYYGDTTFFSFGVFHKEITDVLFNQTDVFGLDVLDAPGFDRSGYAFTTVRNGGDGFVRGAEVFYSATFEDLAADMGLPAWMGGFGARLSLTYVQSEVDVPAVSGIPTRRIRLPGTSDFVYNIQATYEYNDISVRLAYQYRTPWIQSIGSMAVVNGALVPSGNGDVWWDDDAEMDLAVRYQLNDNIEMYFNGENLLDGAGRRYAHTSNFPVEYETFGPRYLIGARFNY